MPPRRSRMPQERRSTGRTMGGARKRTRASERRTSSTTRGKTAGPVPAFQPLAADLLALLVRRARAVSRGGTAA